MLYKSGIISSSGCGTNINHAVNMIGYGTDANGYKYWLLKNSWGTSWGEKGFFRVKRDTTTSPGVCGVLQQSSYPTI
jgi:KDEL-tailed cysteine endopeptidase